MIGLALSPGWLASAQPACRPVSASPLAQLEGFWKVDWSYRLSPGNFLETQGSASIKADLLGCALVEKFTSAIDTIPYESIVVYSAPDEARLDRVTVDSQHGGLMRHEGTMSGDTLSFTWQLDLGTRVIRTRHLYILLSDGLFIREHLLSPSNGAPWELRQRAVYARIKHAED
ncbi:MAG: hypothetical protein KJO98_16160 [Rhodothermia bacterium]|nr:hypothetical protein [Rhodothermia bacterium]